MKDFSADSDVFMNQRYLRAADSLERSFGRIGGELLEVAGASSKAQPHWTATFEGLPFTTTTASRTLLHWLLRRDL
jgi:hypothetical protein